MVQPRVREKLGEYLTISEAAQFLGVSPWTLRNWDKAGRLRPLRHPKNGYRIYRHDDLTAVLDSASQSSSSLLNDVPVPQIEWSEIGDREHFVQFYESDEFLISSVVGFVAAALITGDGAIVIG